MNNKAISKLHKCLLKIYSLLPASLRNGYAFPPLVVQMDLTYRCNLNCKVCFQKKNNTDQKAELTLEEIKNIVNQSPRWSLLTFTGGEPFLRDDFFEILDYSLERRRCNILTNTSMITDRFIDLFISKKLLLIGISLDGIGKTHNRLRNRNGLFDEVIEVINKIQTAKKNKGFKFPLVDIKTLITRENFGELFEILKLAENLKVDFLTFSLPKLSDIQFTGPYNDSIKEIFSSEIKKADKLSSQELRILKKQISLMRNYRGKVAIRFYPYNMFFDIEKYYNNKLKPGFFYPCYVPWSLVCISPYGDVYPCLYYRIGNIRQHELKQLWNAEHFRNFRLMLDRKKLSSCCIGCCYSHYKKEKP